MSTAIRMNTLYLLRRGAYVSREREALQVKVDGQEPVHVPIHHLDGVVSFGDALVTAGAMQLCAERGVALSFLSESGRLLARVDAPNSSSAALRRQQYRLADDEAAVVRLARSIVAGKLRNARATLQRGARDQAGEASEAELRTAAERIRVLEQALPGAASADAVRGYEGTGARLYFGAFPHLIRQQREHFMISGRSRRPPRDPVNALLSYLYAVLLQDCVAALCAAGLDPNVGFLHRDRPGRPSLALDLIEEFRPLVVDRLVLTLINRRQVGPAEVVGRTGGAWELTEAGRRAVIGAYQERKQAEVAHPLLAEPVRVRDLWFIQARLLARHLRGELPAYPPCYLR